MTTPADAVYATLKGTIWFQPLAADEQGRVCVETAKILTSDELEDPRRVSQVATAVYFDDPVPTRDRLKWLDAPAPVAA